MASFRFRRWSVMGEKRQRVFDPEGLMRAGVLIETMSDPASYSGWLSLTYPDGSELVLNFNDIEGRQEVAPQVYTIRELVEEAASQDEYMLDEEFYNLLEFLEGKEEQDG